LFGTLFRYAFLLTFLSFLKLMLDQCGQIGRASTGRNVQLRPAIQSPVAVSVFKFLAEREAENILNKPNGWTAFSSRRCLQYKFVVYKLLQHGGMYVVAVIVALDFLC
jgi:hypothetical protein